MGWSGELAAGVSWWRRGGFGCGRPVSLAPFGRPCLVHDQAAIDLAAKPRKPAVRAPRLGVCPARGSAEKCDLRFRALALPPVRKGGIRIGERVWRSGAWSTYAVCCMWIGAGPTLPRVGRLVGCWDAVRQREGLGQAGCIGDERGAGGVRCGIRCRVFRRLCHAQGAGKIGKIQKNRSLRCLWQHRRNQRAQ